MKTIRGAGQDSLESCQPALVSWLSLSSLYFKLVKIIIIGIVVIIIKLVIEPTCFLRPSSLSNLGGNMVLCKCEEEDKLIKTQPFSENLKVVGDAQPVQLAPQLHLLRLQTSSWWGRDSG